MAISLIHVNTAAKHMLSFSNLATKTSRSYMSSSVPRLYVHESSYYAQNALHNKPVDTHVHNNAGGAVENSEMKFVKNAKYYSDHPEHHDQHDKDFVPQVSSHNDNVSGIGHNQL